LYTGKVAFDAAGWEEEECSGNAFGGQSGQARGLNVFWQVLVNLVIQSYSATCIALVSNMFR
jgi:hypothetical protein